MTRAARPQADRPAAGADPAEGRLVAVLVGVTMVVGIISSLGAPLIPALARSLHVSLQSAQWSLTVALLAAAVAAPLLGRLGDGRRRREAILGGLVVVLAGSVLAGLSNSLGVLIVGRAMQGVGLSLAALTIAAARDHLSADRSPGVIGLLSVAAATAVGAGYPISGLIATELGVHAAFFFGALISAIALIAAVRVIPGTHDAPPARIDAPSAVVAIVGLAALLLAIGQGPEWGWGSPPVVALAAVAVVILAGWARMQLRHPAPLVDLRQLQARAVMTADIAAVALGIALYMFFTLVTEFIQEPHRLPYGLGASSLIAGLVLVPFSGMSLLASRTTPSLVRRASAPAVLVGGSIVISAAGAFFALLHGALWEAFVTMGVIGIGFGYTFAAIPGLILRSVAGGATGGAMGLYQVSRSVGFSIGSALAGSILAGNLIDGGKQVSEAGYVTALWVGTAICAASAAASWWLSRSAPAPCQVQMAVAPARSGDR